MSHLAGLTQNETDVESNISYAGWQIVLAGFFGAMVSFAAVVPYTFGLFIKPLASTFGWHREALSAGFSVAALTLAAASPGLGILFDKFGPRRIILPCILVFASMYASLAWLTPHLFHFYLVFFVIGLVGNGTAYLGYSRAISTWFDARRGLALSVMLAGGSAGAMVLPVMTQAVLSHFGWRPAFLMLGFVSLAVGLPLSAALLRERPVAQQGAQASVLVGDAVSQALRSRILWIIAATVCLYAISVNGAIAHLSALLTDRGVSAHGASYCVAAIGATALLGRVLTGMFLDRFFGARVAQWMLLVSAIGIVLLSVAHTLVAGLIAACLIGFSMGSEGDVTPYLLSRYFGLKRLSTLYALTWTAYAIGGATGPLFVGRLFDAMGAYRPATMQLLSVPALIPCLLLFLLPRYATRSNGLRLEPSPEYVKF